MQVECKVSASFVLYRGFYFASCTRFALNLQCKKVPFSDVVRGVYLFWTQTLELINIALEKIYKVVSENGKILFICFKVLNELIENLLLSRFFKLFLSIAKESW